MDTQDKQSIVFAFYKNNQLIGYRLNTVGSIGLQNPKIYSYSKSQVDIVLKNIDHNVKSDFGFGKALGLGYLASHESKIHKMLQDQKAFEVRVLKAPNKIYEKEFDVEKAEYVTSIWPTYPAEEVEKWLLYPDQHEVIETHWFGMEGLIIQN